jgi:hypothetical protein
MDTSLIAPCGMNCGLCSAYLAYANELPRARGKISHCPGCRPRNKQCAYIKGQCSLLRNNKIDFCFECKNFPCERLKKINNRYNINYSFDFIENLIFIKKNGIEKFVKMQNKKYKCPNCDGMISVHNGKCFKCDNVESWRE